MNIEINEFNIDIDPYVIIHFISNNETINKSIINIKNKIIYRMVKIYQTNNNISNSYMEISCNDNPKWYTEDVDWYNDKLLIKKMNLYKFNFYDFTDLYEYEDCKKTLYNKIFEKIGINKNNYYILLGIDMEYWNKYYINDLKISNISVSVKQISYHDKILGYLILWDNAFISFDPRSWDSDGFYDQYIIKIDKNYILGGNQEYYYNKDIIAGNLKDDKKLKCNSIIDIKYKIEDYNDLDNKQ